jgi:integrase
MALTAVRVARLKKTGRYLDTHGLYLQIGATGAKSWIFRYENAGREHFMGLGPLWLVSLRNARKARDAAALKLLNGINPLAERRAARNAERAAAARSATFLRVAQQFFDAKSEPWSAAHRRAWKQTVIGLTLAGQPCAQEGNHCLSLHRMPIANIGRADIMRVIGPLLTTQPDLAKRLCGRLAQVFDWARVHGLRDDTPNPAQWRNALAHLAAPATTAKAAKHHEAIPYNQIPSFYAALSARPGSARALAFLLLTAVRSKEAMHARWGEIDLNTNLWTIPAQRMKEGAEHRVPLSRAAVSLLKSLPREAGNPYVFLSARRNEPLGTSALWRLMKMMGYSAVPHGLRSSFRSWAADMTSFAPDVAEAALAHRVGNSVERAYSRGDALDKRRELMEQWAQYCEGRGGATILPLRRR